MQERDLGISGDGLNVVTETEPSESDMKALQFAWKVVKHVRSNAIVLVKDGAVVGVGAGQMSRIDSLQISGKKADSRASGSVMATKSAG